MDLTYTKDTEIMIINQLTIIIYYFKLFIIFYGFLNFFKVKKEAKKETLILQGTFILKLIIIKKIIPITLVEPNNTKVATNPGLE